MLNKNNISMVRIIIVVENCEKNSIKANLLNNNIHKNILIGIFYTFRYCINCKQ